MRVSFVATGLLSLAGLINGLDVANLDIFEDLKEIPREWKQLHRAPASKRLHFRIAVTPVCINLDHLLPNANISQAYSKTSRADTVLGVDPWQSEVRQAPEA